MKLSNEMAKVSDLAADLTVCYKENLKSLGFDQALDEMLSAVINAGYSPKEATLIVGCVAGCLKAN